VPILVILTGGDSEAELLDASAKTVFGPAT